MTTALDVIKRSMRLLGVYSTGEDPTADEAQDGLTALNALLDSYSNTGLVYAKTLDTIAVPANTTSITVGPSGGTVTTRPIQVLPESYYTIGDVSYPLYLMTEQEYSDIGLKSVTGLPGALLARMDMPNISLTFWPLPDQDISLKLWSSKALTSALALTTQLSFPPGWERLLPYLLAIDLAPEYEVTPSGAVQAVASQAMRVLKRTNYRVPVLNFPDPNRAVFRDIRNF